MIWRDLSEEEAERLAEACTGFDPFRHLGYRAATLFDYFTRPDRSLDRYAIEMNGVFCGAICLRTPWLRGPFLETLALLPEMQRTGIGSRAVIRAQSEAGRNLWTTVSAFHREARNFYERLGFVEVAPLTGLIHADEDEILLRWQRG